MAFDELQRETVTVATLTPSGRVTRTLRIAPRHQLVLVTLGALLLIAASAWLVLAQPRLGFQFEAASSIESLRVTAVDPQSPNAGRVVPGMVLIALAGPDGIPVSLPSSLLVDVPTMMPYPDYSDYMQQQQALHALLAGNSVTAVTADGRNITVSTRTTPTEALAWPFPVHAFYGLAAVLVSLGIWVFRPHSQALQLYALSGIGVLLITLPKAVHESRELILDGTIFETLHVINHFGRLLCSAALAAMFWVYPRRLSRFPAPSMLLGAAAICWLLGLLEIGQTPRAFVDAPSLLLYLLGLGFAAAQWYTTRNRPLDRAALKWCVLAIFTGSVLLIGLLVLPPALGSPPLVSFEVGFAAFLILYLGLAAGLTRYRLFDVERWWFRAWLWFAGGLLVLAIDALLVLGTGLGSGYALAVSLAVAGWVYFPLRQWLWQRVGRRSHAPLDGALRELVHQLFGAATAGHIHAAWPGLLQRTFRPLRCQPQNEQPEAVAIAPDGARLTVPALGPDHPAMVLEFADNGGRLFSPYDIRVAELLHELTRKALEAVQAREAGAEAERSRIMRDLHDDLGARLLSLVYATDNDAGRDLAREALADLHGLIDMTAGKPVKLQALISACEGEVRKRTNEAGLVLKWRVDPAPHDVDWSARAAANTTRILREAVSNIIRHAAATTVSVGWHAGPNGLVLEVEDDGRGVEPNGWQHGQGTRTICTRAKDLNGGAEWLGRPGGGCTLRVQLPA